MNGHAHVAERDNIFVTAKCALTENQHNFFDPILILKFIFYVIRVESGFQIVFFFFFVL